MNLRKLARNQECQIRSPICTYDIEETVLCHLPIPGTSGMGMKPPDICGAWGCAACHDILDGRRVLEGVNVLELKHEGLLRTLTELHRQGYV